jgi:hypothetical protein
MFPALVVEDVRSFNPTRRDVLVCHSNSLLFRVTDLTLSLDGIFQGLAEYALAISSSTCPISRNARGQTAVQTSCCHVSCVKMDGTGVSRTGGEERVLMRRSYRAASIYECICCFLLNGALHVYCYRKTTHQACFLVSSPSSSSLTLRGSSESFSMSSSKGFGACFR